MWYINWGQVTEPDNYPHAEERRLLYVALTRAKKQAHLIVDLHHPSPFSLELINDDYKIRIIGKDKEIAEICPECKSGFILEKKPDLYACSNFPYCEYIAPLCSMCSEEHMTPSKLTTPEQFDCVDIDCSGTAPKCPKCGIGAVIPKSGKFGKFFGCHIWPRCNHTRNSIK